MKKFFVMVAAPVCKLPSKVTRLAVTLLILGSSVAANAQGSIVSAEEAAANFDVSGNIIAFLPTVQNICYAIAAVVGIVGALNIFLKMNNEEQDIKKSIMLLIGSVIAFVALVAALPIVLGVA